MSLTWHISIHIFLSLLAGFAVFLISKKFWVSFLPVIVSGVVIDFDHLIDYFLAFGRYFRLDYFLSGYQFLKSGKTYVLFHAWEYVIILVVLAVIVKKNPAKIALFSLALGLFFHLSTDCMLNEGMKPQTYSLAYRIRNGFDVKNLVTEEHYKNHLKQKESVKFE